MIRAQKNPGADWNWDGKSREEIAKEYGLTVSVFNRHALDFLESEGYEEDGTLRRDLHEYLTGRVVPYRDNTPWQKGDDTPG
jgi:hypothetical protein